MQHDIEIVLTRAIALIRTGNLRGIGVGNVKTEWAPTLTKDKSLSDATSHQTLVLSEFVEMLEVTIASTFWGTP